jgi:hypothetical protein
MLGVWAPLEPLHRQTVETADWWSDPGGFWAPLVAIVLAVWLVHHALAFMGRRGWINYRGAVFGAAIGNALVGFAAFFQPDRPSVESLEKIRNPRLQDDAGDDPKV